MHHTDDEININLAVKSVSDTLNAISQQFIQYLPLIFLVFGLIGFLGNLLTYLQVELRSNTCCIYSLCGSIVDIITIVLNQFPNYLNSRYGIMIFMYNSSISCKITLFFLVFLPHLSVNFLLMAIIDRFACTCPLNSPIRRLNRLGMVPWMTGVAVLTSALCSLYAPLLFNLLLPMLCASTRPTISSILYVIIIGLLQPIVMLLFVYLTYRNLRHSRRRVNVVRASNHQRSRHQLILTIFLQIFVTAFITIQWIIFYMYFTITMDQLKTSEQYTIIDFVLGLTNNIFYLNNVKSFYLSMLTSRLCRQTFLKGLNRLLPRSLHRLFQASPTNLNMKTITKTQNPYPSRL